MDKMLEYPERKQKRRHAEQRKTGAFLRSITKIHGKKMSYYTEKRIKAEDGYILTIRTYDAVNPKAVVKIIHGMEEHQGRYEDFAVFLREAGYTVVTADLRGHGPDAPLLSHIADKNGDQLLLQDEETIMKLIQKEYSGIPVVLFSHSMGAIIARVILQTRSRDYAKVILAGYPNPNKIIGFGLMLTRISTVLRGAKSKSKLLDSMAVGPFSKGIPDSESKLDWLSVNRANVEKYMKDPLCGVAFSVGSYNALFRLIARMPDVSLCRDVNEELPILLISGEADPCTGGEQGRRDSLELLREYGFRRIKVEMLPGMRHEILNETEKETTYQEILNFLDS